MDFIFELIFDLILEGSSEVAKDNKRSPWIRIPCLILILLVGIAIIGSLGFFGVYMLVKPTDSTSYIAGAVCILGDLVLILEIIKEFKKYKKSLQNNDKKMQQNCNTNVT